jgi:hypothetical protein
MPIDIYITPTTRRPRRDSNPQPSDPKSDALSIKLRGRDFNRSNMPVSMVFSWVSLFKVSYFSILSKAFEYLIPTFAASNFTITPNSYSPSRSFLLDGRQYMRVDIHLLPNPRQTFAIFLYKP